MTYWFIRMIKTKQDSLKSSSLCYISKVWKKGGPCSHSSNKFGILYIYVRFEKKKMFKSIQLLFLYRLILIWCWYRYRKWQKWISVSLIKIVYSVTKRKLITQNICINTTIFLKILDGEYLAYFHQEAAEAEIIRQVRQDSNVNDQWHINCCILNTFSQNSGFVFQLIHFHAEACRFAKQMSRSSFATSAMICCAMICVQKIVRIDCFWTLSCFMCFMLWLMLTCWNKSDYCEQLMSCS